MAFLMAVYFHSFAFLWFMEHMNKNVLYDILNGNIFSHGGSLGGSLKLFSFLTHDL